ncbi:DUF5071 domain-containing protein [Mycena indigotica]|uniref:DUF5071 domain-containing protein n=1 Tax=Mycena indigotica TaxID=2126181 RepID=A0A8H6SNC3_9AGAR|nr:DUF5071 domain-containing protein [Mycena indigotica]KAF7302025.1 DUF5071 domain-containing protein [Mycena indigotica]
MATSTVTELDVAALSGPELALLLPTLPLEAEYPQRPGPNNSTSAHILELLKRENNPAFHGPLSTAILTTISTLPLATATDAEIDRVAFLLFEVIMSLPRSDIEYFRSALTHLTTSPLGRLDWVNSGSNDVLRYLDASEPYTPTHKTDNMSIRSIQEGVHSSEEMRPFLAHMVFWMTTSGGYWLVNHGAPSQLARFPALAVDGILYHLHELAEEGENIEVHWAVKSLLFVLREVPSHLREPLRPAIERIAHFPVDDDDLNDDDDWDWRNSSPQVALRLLMEMDYWVSIPSRMRSRPSK